VGGDNMSKRGSLCGYL